MKSYTDIEQSKKLAEILPLESADMTWVDYGYCKRVLPKDDVDANAYPIIIPAWSLAALLETIPKDIEGLNRLRIDLDNEDFSIWYDDLKEYGVNDKLPDITLKEPVDACLEMIVTLKEKRLL